MFSIDSLGTSLKVIGIESWLEDTLDRKRNRKDESAPSNDTLSLVIHSSLNSLRSRNKRPCLSLGKILKQGI